MSGIKWGEFIFDAPDTRFKQECCYCGAEFFPYPLAVAIHATRGKSTVSDAACVMCSGCILRTPKEVAALARKNAVRLEELARDIGQKDEEDRTKREDLLADYAPIHARSARLLARGLDELGDFSKLPHYALAAHHAMFYQKPKGKDRKAA